MPFCPARRLRPASAAAGPVLLGLALLPVAGCRRSNGLPDYPPGYREFAYVANQAGNSVSVLDLVQLRPERTLGVPDGPLAVVAAPARDEVYVVSAVPDRSSGVLTVIDSSRNEIASRIPLGRAPSALALSRDGRWAYVPNSGSGTLATVDLLNRRLAATTPAGHHPTGISVAPDGRSVVVTDAAAGTAQVFATSPQTGTPTLRSTYDGCPGATAPTILPDSSKVFIACQSGHRVLVVGLAAEPGSWDARQEPSLLQDRKLALLDVGQEPGFLTLKPDGGEIFSSNVASDTVSEIATTANEVGSTYPIGTHPLHGIVDKDNAALWISASGTDSVSLYSIVDGKFLSSIRTGSGPDALAFASGGALLLAADTRSGDVALIRTATKLGPALLTILPAGAHPVAIAVKAMQGKP